MLREEYDYREENYEYDGVSIGDMPLEVREAYYESLEREKGSLYEEYC